MIIQVEGGSAEDVAGAKRALTELADGWGLRLDDAASFPAEKDRDDGAGTRGADPVALASLIVALPSAALAVADLADRIIKRRRARELTDKAESLSGKGVTVFLVTETRKAELRTLTPDEVVDLAAEEGDAGADGQGHAERAVPGSAQSAFIVGLALSKQADFEAARGALLTCALAGDPEWSPRGAGLLGEMLWDRGDPAGAAEMLRMAVDAGHPEWSASAGLTLGVVLASRGDKSGAEQAYRAVLATGHADHAPNAWFNLGTLHQQNGDAAQAVAAFREAVASGHREIAPKAGVNLGFVLFNNLRDRVGAESAFQAVIASGHRQQAALAAQNLEAISQLTASAGGQEDTRRSIDGVTDVSVGHSQGGFKWKLWHQKKS